MNSIRVLLCDDDAGIRKVLRLLIERTDGFVVLGETENAEDCLEFIRKDKPDLVFLDVEMPGMNGVECARQIQDEDPMIMLIFATAHEQYMGDAFQVYAFDYLVKPFRNQRVLQTLERIRSIRQNAASIPASPPAVRSGNRQRRLFLRNKDGATVLDMEDILLIQRENRYTVLYTADNRYTTNDTLSVLEERLDPDLFFRCHKSYIINLHAVDTIFPYGRWTYIVKLHGISQDALITHDKFEELESIFV